MNAAPDILLEVDGLGKRFPSRDGREPSPWILQNVSFSVREGEFVTLIGPSGSGKSTLLNLIAQVDSPTEGRIMFRNQVISEAGNGTQHPGWHRQIGYVTQDDNLLPWRTMLDNVLLPFELQSILDNRARDRAALLISAVGLTGFEKYFPHELSGGMRKRASLIRTLVYDPPIILMDEPFGALDARTRAQLQSDLLALWTLGRKTIIFVTHDIAEAIALGDRTLVLTRGPAKVASQHIIDIPRPRDIDDVLSLDQFPKLYASIKAQFK
jgi:NitT/TauT family transport system ATP-binding protein